MSISDGWIASFSSSVSRRSKGPSNASRSSSRSRTALATSRTLAARIGRGSSARSSSGPRVGGGRFAGFGRPLPAPLREPNQTSPATQTSPETHVLTRRPRMWFAGSTRTSSIQKRPKRVEGDVEGEEPRWPRAETPLDHVDEQRRGEEVPEQLVEERRVVGRLIERRERPVARVDLEPPRQVGRLAEELLVPPVADPPDRLGDEQARVRGSRRGATRRRRRAWRSSRRRDSRAAIPPQTPRPPFQIANGPHHWSGTSSQLVAR